MVHLHRGVPRVEMSQERQSHLRLANCSPPALTHGPVVFVLVDERCEP